MAFLRQYRRHGISIRPISARAGRGGIDIFCINWDVEARNMAWALTQYESNSEAPTTVLPFNYKTNQQSDGLRTGTNDTGFSSSGK